jgi:hypothetical protein
VSIKRTFGPAAPVGFRNDRIEALGYLSTWPIEIFSGEEEG